MIESVSTAALGVPETPAASSGQGGTSPSTAGADGSSTTARASPGGSDAAQKASARAAAAPVTTPTTRLEVSDDGAQGFIYKLMDVATGRLLMQLPRDQVQKLSEDPNYASGSLVSRVV